MTDKQSPLRKGSITGFLLVDQAFTPGNASLVLCPGAGTLTSDGDVSSKAKLPILNWQEGTTAADCKAQRTRADRSFELLASMLLIDARFVGHVCTALASDGVKPLTIAVPAALAITVAVFVLCYCSSRGGKSLQSAIRAHKVSPLAEIAEEDEADAGVDA